MNGYLTRNTKMLKSSGPVTWNWGIPAFRAKDGSVTCPSAGRCAAGCFARAGWYPLDRVQRHYERRLALARSPMFVPTLAGEIAARRVKRLRIHDSGDFFSEKYLQDWIQIMGGFPETEFYTYTKRVRLLKAYAAARELPDNFHVVYSFGGLEDRLIDTAVDAHCRVFETEGELLAAGYSNASHDDAIAADGAERVGIVYHGQRLYRNTLWPRVGKPKARWEMGAAG